MANIFDVPVDKLLSQVKEDLKKQDKIQPPSWAAFCKTGAHAERPPMEADWWHMRAASVLRKLHVLGPIGVSKLRRFYGGRPNRGHQPAHHTKGSGNIVRKVLQQLDAAGLTRQVDVQGHKGRILTPQGKSLLDKAATAVQKTLPRVERKEKKEEVPEVGAEKKETEKAKPKAKAPKKAEAKAPAPIPKAEPAETPEQAKPAEAKTAQEEQ